MEESKEIINEIVHMARLALAGRRRDVQPYIRHLVQRYRKKFPELAQKLDDLFREAPGDPSQVETIPGDVDSRLWPARREFPVLVEQEPIWAQEVREKLEQLMAEHVHQSELLEASLHPTRSALFTGKPGVGKTLAGRWVAKALERPLLTLDLSAVMSSFLGRRETNVRYVLDHAKGVECVLLLELDALPERRNDATEMELQRFVTVILQEVQNWPPSRLLLAATNQGRLLAPAVKSRFELVVDFPMPTVEQARDAIELLLGRQNDIKHEWVDALVTTLHGQSSFRDIERDIRRAQRHAVVRNEKLKTALLRLVRERLEPLGRERRQKLAFQLTRLGCSQREASEWTGVSRDTIRKMTRTGRRSVSEASDVSRTSER